MREDVVTPTNVRASLLAEAMVDVVAELRLIDVGDMIGYISAHQWATIADLVQSSTELSFRDDTLSFACMADYEVGWARAPRISLEFEFQTPAVSAFFTLILDQTSSVVDLKRVWFAAKQESDMAATCVLAEALASARLPVGAMRGV